MTKNHHKTWLFNQLLLLILFLCLSACATGGPRMIRHSFSFNTVTDSSDGKHPEAEVIDYQYGSSGQFWTYANREMVSLGKTFKGTGITGLMARGEFLYVKWRILTTGEVFEDRVDLTTRLPKELEGLKLHFVVRGPQLYIFLIYPWDGKSWDRESYRTEFLPIPGGVKRFHGHKYLQLYPEPPIALRHIFKSSHINNK